MARRTFSMLARPSGDPDPSVSSYSLLFASRGANVVVNDFNAEAAQKVVDEIVKGMSLVHKLTAHRALTHPG